MELIDANDEVLSTSSGSVESYTVRSNKDEFKTILAFGDSAYNKFH